MLTTQNRYRESLRSIRGVFLLLVCLQLAVLSCSHARAPQLHRLALLPANVLIANPSSEWLKIAAPLIIEQDLESSPNVIAVPASDESAAYQTGAEETLRTTIESRSGAVRIQSQVTGLSSQRDRLVLSSSSVANHVISELDAIAAKLDSHATLFPTQNEQALRAFTVGISSGSVQSRIQSLNQATVLDPSFGLAYVALLETQSGVAGADSGPIWARAESNENSFTPLDRARLKTLRSRLVQAPLPQQAESAAALVRLAPNDAEALSALGSTLFLLGKGVEGEQVMSRALTVSPGNRKLLGELASGLIQTKRFAQAEKILANLDENGIPSPGLASCILLENDKPRADAVFGRFLESVPNREAKIFLHASWMALTGQSTEAIQLLRQTSFADPRIAGLTTAQIVVWQLMANNFEAARTTAGAVNGIPAPGNVITTLLGSGAKSAEDWRTKVAALPSSVIDEEGKVKLLANGLFLFGFYSEAAQAWQRIELASGGANLPARTMLATSWKRAGDTAKARAVPLQPFLPDFGDLYSALSFNELRKLIAQ